MSDLNGGEKTLMQLFNSFWYTVQGKSQLLLQRRLARFLALHCRDICRLNLLGYVAQKAGRVADPYPDSIGSVDPDPEGQK